MGQSHQMIILDVRLFSKLKMYQAPNNAGDMNGKGWNVTFSVFSAKGEFCDSHKGESYVTNGFVGRRKKFDTSSLFGALANRAEECAANWDISRLLPYLTTPSHICLHLDRLAQVVWNPQSLT